MTYTSQYAFQARNDNIGISFSLVNLRHYLFTIRASPLHTQTYDIPKRKQPKKSTISRAHAIDVISISIHSAEPEQSCKRPKRIAVK